jgi:toxin ParE1/3/4
VKLQVHVDAGVELEAAAAWYERQREGLGAELLEEVGRAFEVILASPTTWPFVPNSREMRRFVLSRFPYTIMYAESSESVRIFAVAHHKRRPGYWRGRRFK